MKIAPRYLDKRNCKVCNKEFFVRKIGKSRSIGGTDVRKITSKTCSDRCSSILTDKHRNKKVKA